MDLLGKDYEQEIIPPKVSGESYYIVKESYDALEEDVSQMEKRRISLTQEECKSLVTMALDELLAQYGQHVDPDIISKVFPRYFVEAVPDGGITVGKMKIYFLHYLDYLNIQTKYSKGMSLVGRMQHMGTSAMAFGIETPVSVADISPSEDPSPYYISYKAEDHGERILQLISIPFRFDRQDLETQLKYVIKHESLHALGVGNFDSLAMKEWTVDYFASLQENGEFIDVKAGYGEGKYVIQVYFDILKKIGVSNAEINKAFLASDPSAMAKIQMQLISRFGQDSVEGILNWRFSVPSQAFPVFKRLSATLLADNHNQTTIGTP